MVQDFSSHSCILYPVSCVFKRRIDEEHAALTRQRQLALDQRLAERRAAKEGDKKIDKSAGSRAFGFLTRKAPIATKNFNSNTDGEGEEDEDDEEDEDKEGAVTPADAYFSAISGGSSSGQHLESLLPSPVFSLRLRLTVDVDSSQARRGPSAALVSLL